MKLWGQRRKVLDDEEEGQGESLKDVRKKKEKNEDFNVPPFGGIEVAKKKIKKNKNRDDLNTL
jgi:hypothetical protein